jgi:hypothetical protein
MSKSLKTTSGNSDQIDRFKELPRELGCDKDEATFDAAVKKLSVSKPLPKHEPKKKIAS